MKAVDRWLPTLADPEWLAASQEPDDRIAAEHAHINQQLAEIDRAAQNLVSAIEAGTDPALINPRLGQLRTEREQLDRRRATLAAPDRLSPADIDALLNELGGMTSILGEAAPPEKARIYQGLGLHLVYQPDQNALVATADLGRIFSRVGGGT